MEATVLNGDMYWEEEIEVEVDFDFDPPEPETGYNGGGGIISVYRKDNGAEICMLDDSLEVELNERCMNAYYQKIYEASSDFRYDYQGY
jgi:hypothetical protein